MSLGGHRGVVLSGQFESGRAASVLTALHQDQFGHEPVDRLVVSERFVDPEPKRTSIVQLGFQDAGILGQHVLPVPDPVIGPTWVG